MIRWSKNTDISLKLYNIYNTRRIMIQVWVYLTPNVSKRLTSNSFGQIVYIIQSDIFDVKIVQFNIFQIEFFF